MCGARRRGRQRQPQTQQETGTKIQAAAERIHFLISTAELQFLEILILTTWIQDTKSDSDWPKCNGIHQGQLSWCFWGVYLIFAFFLRNAVEICILRPLEIIQMKRLTDMHVVMGRCVTQPIWVFAFECSQHQREPKTERSKENNKGRKQCLLHHQIHLIYILTVFHLLVFLKEAS